jgi:hypothetical protein
MSSLVIRTVIILNFIYVSFIHDAQIASQLPPVWAQHIT